MTLSVIGISAILAGVIQNIAGFGASIVLLLILHLCFTYKPYVQFLLLLAVTLHASLGIRVILLDFNLAKICSARRLVPWTLGLGLTAALIAWFAIY